MNKLSFFLNSKNYLLFLSLIIFRSLAMSNWQNNEIEKYRRFDTINGANEILKDLEIGLKIQQGKRNNINNEDWQLLLNFILEKLADKKERRKAIDKLNSEEVFKLPNCYILAGLIIYRANFGDSLSRGAKTTKFKQLNQSIEDKKIDFIESNVWLRDSAIESGHIWLFEFLISQEINFELKNLGALVLLAARENSLVLLEYCIEEDADLDYQEKIFGMSGLMYAAYKGYTPIMKRFIKDSVNIDAVDKKGQAAIGYAIESGNTEIVELLLEEGAYTDIELLTLACFHGYSEIIDLLIDRIDVNEANSDGTTPLMMLAKDGNKKMAKKIIKKGADVNVEKVKFDREGNSHKETALEIATFYGYPEVMWLLYKKGATELIFCMDNPKDATIEIPEKPIVI